MSMIYCHKHNRHIDTDYYEDCPECLSEAQEAAEAWTPTVELVTHDQAPGLRDARDRWGIAQWLEAPATAIPHWHVWRYSSDMLVAMQDAMQEAQRGGRWALVCPAPDARWKGEQVLNEALLEPEHDDVANYDEHYLTGE